MNTAASYARALSELVSAQPKRGRRLLSNPLLALKRRGHLGLLPRIYAQYRCLEEADRRRTLARAVTPERERTRMLLELYKKLIENPNS